MFYPFLYECFLNETNGDLKQLFKHLAFGKCGHIITNSNILVFNGKFNLPLNWTKENHNVIRELLFPLEHREFNKEVNLVKSKQINEWKNFKKRDRSRLIDLYVIHYKKSNYMIRVAILIAVLMKYISLKNIEFQTNGFIKSVKYEMNDFDFSNKEAIA